MQVSAALKGATSNPFPATYSDKVRQIGVVNDKNRRITNLVAKLLDGPAWLRGWIIDRYIVEGFRFDQLMTDDDALEAFVRKARSACGMRPVPAAWAPTGTRWRSPTIKGG